MASNAAKAAHRGDGGDLRNSHSGRGDVSETNAIALGPQGRLIARIAKSAREEFRVGIGIFNGIAKCELRVFALDGQGNWRPTPKAVVIPGGSLSGITAAFCEVEARL
jgi:hypothetical protein